jgi:hypothetical protein
MAKFISGGRCMISNKTVNFVQKIAKKVLCSFWSFVGFALMEIYEAHRTNYRAPHVNHTPSFAEVG